MNNNFGYPTDAPCCICGMVDNNKLEPRFCYVVCSEHQKLSPVEVSKIKIRKELSWET
jgi:translation initiation factor 2 beta subunit (eIF-2beta)/eIF-5